MKRPTNLASNIAKKMILKEAKKAASTTCWGPCFQMKEPKSINKLKDSK